MPWQLMRRLLPMSLITLIEHIKREWFREDTLHMRKIAQRYADRALMEGHVIKKTGEVFPKESV